MKEIRGRNKSLLIIVAIYIIATAIGGITYWLLPLDWWLSLLIADVVATIVVFVFSCIFKNASVYDPYWSVQPLIIVAAFAMANGSGGAGVYALLAITCWAIRLTGNWVYTFHGLSEYEDWRYRMLREKSGKFYPVINFTGIHMVPTLIVWATTLPAVVMVRDRLPLNWGAAIFITLMFGSVLLELIPDLQMHRFRKEGQGGFIRTGLWKYSRHPNYLGEISFWWFLGLALVCLVPVKWYLLAGAFANTVLFLAVSIPMADKHQARKPGFPEYKKATHMLLPIKKKA